MKHPKEMFNVILVNLIFVMAYKCSTLYLPSAAISTI